MFITILNICISSSSLPQSSITFCLNRLISTGQVEQSHNCSYFKQCCIFDISPLFHVDSYMSGLTLLSRRASEDTPEHSLSGFFLVQIKVSRHFLRNPPLMQSQLSGFGVRYDFAVIHFLSVCASCSQTDVDVFKGGDCWYSSAVSTGEGCVAALQGFFRPV